MRGPSDLRELNEANFVRFDARLEQRVAELRQALAEQRSDLVRWMFIFWAGNVATTAGLVFGMVALMRR